MSTKAELACVYSALILVDDDVAITVSKFIKFFIFFHKKTEHSNRTLKMSTLLSERNPEKFHHFPIIGKKKLIYCVLIMSIKRI